MVRLLFLHSHLNIIALSRAQRLEHFRQHWIGNVCKYMRKININGKPIVTLARESSFFEFRRLKVSLEFKKEENGFYLSKSFARSYPESLRIALKFELNFVEKNNKAYFHGLACDNFNKTGLTVNLNHSYESKRAIQSYSVLL